MPQHKRSLKSSNRKANVLRAKKGKARTASINNSRNFSWYTLAIFIIIFAGIGSYLIYSSFAASTTGTFGKTNIGAKCATFTNNWKRVNKYHLGTTGTITRINVYLKKGTTGGTQQLKGVLYADNNGQPSALIAVTNQLSYTGSSANGWYGLTFAAAPSVKAGNYWIGILSGNAARVASYCYDTGASNVRKYNTNPYSSGPTNPFGNVSQDNRIMSLNATYTTSSPTGGTAPTVSLTASPLTLTAGQATILTWSATNAKSCSASWANTIGIAGSQSVTPATTTAYTMTCNGISGSTSKSVTVAVSTPTTGGGGGSGSCTTTLSGSQTTQLLGNTYHLQSNEWASGAPFSICTNGSASFKITNSGIANSLSGAPGAYPSLYVGCHWGYCTSGSGMPVAVSRMTAASTVTTSYNTTTVANGAWDDAYDIWFNANSTTNSNNTGLEMMIWLSKNGPIQPAGKVIANNVNIGGRTYTVWYGGSGNGGTVSYVMTSPVTSITNLDLGPFAADSVKRGYMQNSWFLIDVEAGFEPWQGGQGLTANSFSVTVH